MTDLTRWTVYYALPVLIALPNEIAWLRDRIRRDLAGLRTTRGYVPTTSYATLAWSLFRVFCPGFNLFWALCLTVWRLAEWIERHDRPILRKRDR